MKLLRDASSLRPLRDVAGVRGEEEEEEVEEEEVARDAASAISASSSSEMGVRTPARARVSRAASAAAAAEDMVRKKTEKFLNQQLPSDVPPPLSYLVPQCFLSLISVPPPKSAAFATVGGAVLADV